MFRKKNHVPCNYHYHYMMPAEMAPMGLMYGAGQMPEMTDMYGNGCPMPDYMYGSHDGSHDESHYGSHLDGNPFVGAGAFVGGPFFSPFFFPFFFSRRFFPFFPFFFF